jgi:hypothetical protein
MTGKGDIPRPLAITEDEFGDRWVKTFCPPVRDPVTAATQPGLRRPTDWPATDPLDHPDTED